MCTTKLVLHWAAKSNMVFFKYLTNLTPHLAREAKSLNSRQHRSPDTGTPGCSASPSGCTWRTPSVPCTTWPCRGPRPPGRSGTAGSPCRRRWPLAAPSPRHPSAPRRLKKVRRIIQVRQRIAPWFPAALKDRLGGEGERWRGVVDFGRGSEGFRRGRGVSVSLRRVGSLLQNTVFT